MARKDVSVGDAVLGKSVEQGAGDVILTGHVGKTLRAVLAS
jgi:hypothetical protein